MKPFLKWAGGKYKIVNRIKQLLPAGTRLVEPFTGSAALFLNTDFPSYLLADINPDLITLYQTLQVEGAPFVDYCQTFFAPENNDKAAYYAFREQFNSTADPRLKSALFLYLNKHCFNGLCRYNAGGEFNVPFGRYKKPYFPRPEMLFFHQQAQRATIIQANFVTVMEACRPGDVVYCDPPYVPLSDTANFTSYSAGKFGLEQQVQLARLAESLAGQGIPVVISNHNTAFTRRQYRRAVLNKFPVQRHISRDGANRTKVNELLALFS